MNILIKLSQELKRLGALSEAFRVANLYKSAIKYKDSDKASTLEKMLGVLNDKLVERGEEPIDIYDQFRMMGDQPIEKDNTLEEFKRAFLLSLDPDPEVAHIAQEVFENYDRPDLMYGLVAELLPRQTIAQINYELADLILSIAQEREHANSATLTKAQQQLKAWSQRPGVFEEPGGEDDYGRNEDLRKITLNNPFGGNQWPTDSFEDVVYSLPEFIFPPSADFHHGVEVILRETLTTPEDKKRGADIIRKYVNLPMLREKMLGEDVQFGQDLDTDIRFSRRKLINPSALHQAVEFFTSPSTAESDPDGAFEVLYQILDNPNLSTADLQKIYDFSEIVKARYPGPAMHLKVGVAQHQNTDLKLLEKLYEDPNDVISAPARMNPKLKNYLDFKMLGREDEYIY